MAPASYAKWFVLLTSAGVQGETPGSLRQRHMTSLPLAVDLHREGSRQTAVLHSQVFWGHRVRVADFIHKTFASALSQQQATQGQRQTSIPEHQITIQRPSILKEYNLDVSAGDWSYSQMRQDKLLAPILSQISNGFFVESGARDGETHSNTIYYERRGWTGLLIEPSWQEYPKIKSKLRNAYSFQGCLSPTAHPEWLYFIDSGDGLSKLDQSGEVLVQAEPLANLLEELGRKTVDFWSLDVEGSESQVLNATDFHRVEVGVLLVEMNKGEENNAGVKRVMDREGFIDIGVTRSFNGAVLDHIFVNPVYFTARDLQVPCMNSWYYAKLYLQLGWEFLELILLPGPNGCHASWCLRLLVTVVLLASMARIAIKKLVFEEFVAKDSAKEEDA